VFDFEQLLHGIDTRAHLTMPLIYRFHTSAHLKSELENGVIQQAQAVAKIAASGAAIK
jgi:hypothetical protein